MNKDFDCVNKLLVGWVANMIVEWLNKIFLHSFLINFMFLRVRVFRRIIY